MEVLLGVNESKRIAEKDGMGGVWGEMEGVRGRTGIERARTEN